MAKTYFPTDDEMELRIVFLANGNFTASVKWYKQAATDTLRPYAQFQAGDIVTVAGQQGEIVGSLGASYSKGVTAPRYTVNLFASGEVSITERKLLDDNPSPRVQKMLTVLLGLYQEGKGRQLRLIK